MRSLNLQQGESVVVHRGMSSPICYLAEQGKMAANQMRDGFTKTIAGVLYGVSDTKGEISLKFHSVSKLAVKNVGEPNALIHEPDSPFMDWWCHVVKVEGVDFGLIGRPNRKKLGGRYEPAFPHVISTTTWGRVLACLPAESKEYQHDVRAAKYPYMAAAFDASRSGLDRSFLESL